MSAQQKAELHAIMTLKLFREIKQFSPEYQIIQEFTSPHIRPGEMSNCHNIMDIINMLQNKGVIRIGKYDELKSIFMKAEREDLIDIIRETEQKFDDLCICDKAVDSEAYEDAQTYTYKAMAAPAPQKCGKCRRPHNLSNASASLRHQVSNLEVDEKILPKDLELVSLEIASDWKLLLRQLGVNEAEIVDAHADTRQRRSEVTLTCLNAWKKEKHTATLHCLCNALIGIKHNALCLKLLETHKSM